MIDLARRMEIHRFALGAAPNRLAVAGNGTALLFTSGSASVMQVDLVTGAIRDRGTFRVGDPILTARYLERSRDHSRILLFGGALLTYGAATDSFSQPRTYGFGSPFASVDRTGAKSIISGTHVLDAQLDVRATISDDGSTGALAIDDLGTVAYRAHGSSIDVLDLALDRVTATIPLPAPSAFSVEMGLSADDGTLVAFTQNGLLVIPLSAAVPVPPCTPHASGAGVFGVCGRLADVVVGADGRAYATNPDLDQVEVVNLVTGHAEAPIHVGSQPRGLDLSPDGRTLYVADWGGAEVSVIDTASRHELRRIRVPLPLSYPLGGPDWDGPFSIGVADNGTALITTSIKGKFGGVRLIQLDLADGSLVPRADLDTLAANDIGPIGVAASVDHSLVTVDLSYGSTHGYVALYTSATDSITPWQPLSGTGPAAAAAGGPRVLAVPGATVFDLDMAVQGAIPGGGKAVAVNASGTTGYRVQDGSIDVLDLAGRLQIGSIVLPEAVGTAPGTVAITPDGARLAVLTASGLSVVDTAAGATTPKSPYAVWGQPTSAALDAVGTWVVPANVPAAGSGQLPPSYLYAHYFNFTQSSAALGVIGLVTSGGTKLVAFGIVDGAGTPHSVGLAFDWAANHAYYLFVAQLNPSAFGGWVYDNTAGAWTFIGQVDLPVPLGKIAPATVTQVIWFGPTGSTCSRVPRGRRLLPPAGRLRRGRHRPGHDHRVRRRRRRDLPGHGHHRGHAPGSTSTSAPASPDAADPAGGGSAEGTGGAECRS